MRATSRACHVLLRSHLESGAGRAGRQQFETISAPAHSGPTVGILRSAACRRRAVIPAFSKVAKIWDMTPARLERAVQVWCEVVTFVTLVGVEVTLSIAGAWHTPMSFLTVFLLGPVAASGFHLAWIGWKRWRRPKLKCQGAI